MSWLGGSLSSFTDQISSLTKDILTEGTEEVSDPTTELKLAQAKIKELEAVLSTQKSENDRVKEFIRETEEKAEASEFQVNSISREYRTLLQEKEVEIKELKARQHAMLEEQKTMMSSEDMMYQPASHTYRQTPASGGIDNFHGDEHEFGDSISMQHDINRLSKEVQKLQSECVHWKRMAVEGGGQSSDVAKHEDSGEITQLQTQLKNLQHDISRSEEQHQQEVVALQHHHRSQLAALKRKHQEEIEDLQEEGQITEVSPEKQNEELKSLQQQQKEVHEEMEEVKRQLQTSESERALATQMLAELEGTTLQMKEKNELLEQKVSELNSELSVCKSETEDLRKEKKSLEEEVRVKEVQLQGAQEELHTLRGDNKQAHVLEVLSDLQHVRHQVGDETIERKKQLLLEKQQLVNHLIAAGEKKSELIAEIETTKKSQQELDSQTQELLETRNEEKSKEMLDALKSEVLELTQKSSSQQEKITQLEKDKDSLMKEKIIMESTLQELQANVVESKGVLSESDWNMSIGQSSGPVTSSTPFIREETGGETEQIKHLQSQLTLYKDRLEEMDCEKADWTLEKEALEDVLMDLRKQLKKTTLSQSPSIEDFTKVKNEKQKLQEELDQALIELDNIRDEKSEILRHEGQSNDAIAELQTIRRSLSDKDFALNNLMSEKADLETSLEELDQQHNEAMAQLISIRDGLVKQNEQFKQQLTEKDVKLMNVQAELAELKLHSSQNVSHNLSEVSMELEKLKKQHEKLQLEKKTQSVELDKVNCELSSADQSLVELNQKDIQLEETLKVKSEVLQETKSKLDHVVQERTWIDKAYKDTLDKLQLAEDRLEALEESTAFDSSNQDHLEEELNALRFQLNESLEFNQSQKATLEDIQTELDISKEELVSLQHDKAVLEERLSEINLTKTQSADLQQSSDLQMENQALKTQLEALRNEKEVLKRELDQSEQKLHNQHKNYENYIQDLKRSQTMEGSGLNDELNKSVSLSHEKDVRISSLEEEILSLKEQLTDAQETTQSAIDSQQQLSGLVSEKESEILQLRKENLSLNDKIEEEQKSVHDLKEKVSVSRKIQQELVESQEEVENLKCEVESLKSVSLETSGDSDRVDARTLDVITDMESELHMTREKVHSLEEDKKKLTQMISEKDIKITDLVDSINSLKQTEEELKAQISQQDDDIKELKQAKVIQESNREPVLPTAMEYSEKGILDVKQRENKDTMSIEEKHTLNNDRNFTNINGHFGRSMSEDSDTVTVEIEKLQQIIRDKDSVIQDLQNSNSSFIKMLESKGLSSTGDKTLVDVHKLENEVRSLKTEREQILAVMNEKSRESSKLKSEVHRLMNIISAEKTALDKLTQDNNHLLNNKTTTVNDDMQKEALQNLSRIIRDKDLEIESLSQKNQTLLQVLQDSSQDGSQLSSLMLDRDNLSKQLAVIQGERDQMITFVNQKHQESLTYHNEVQRLTVFINEENQKFEKLQNDYANLVPEFEDKKKSLLKVQNELINYKQKYSELEVKYGEMVQKSNITDVVDRYTYSLKEEEASKLQERLTQTQSTLQGKEAKINSLNQRVGELELSVSSTEAEKNNYKKQVEHLSFQMNSLRREVEVTRQDSIEAEKDKSEHNSQVQTLRETHDQVMLSVREKEFELTMLKEKCNTLTAMLQQKDGEEGQLDRLLKDNETLNGQARTFQQERDQLMLVLRQRQTETDQLKEQVEKCRVKEEKLTKELDRLRGHLLQIEDGYTQEALAAEEREKELRNRLATAEEKLLSSSAAVDNVNLHASQQLESLQQQLMMIGGQRDAAYHQVAALQEQCQQYTASLVNLQLVLEQFQQERESSLANETDRYRKQITELSNEVTRLKSELSSTRAQLEEASDGLEAAARLSEQLDKKQSAIDALREEVQLREKALKDSEDEKKKITTTSEAKVDKVLVKNLLVGYLSTPSSKRNEALKVIGVVLNFNNEDFHKVLGDNPGSWIPGFLRFGRSPVTPPATPTRQSSLDKSFSELFVKFLEKESSPPPPIMHLPAEQMAQETQQKQREKEKEHPSRPPQFNPFTAPRHAVMPIQIGGRSSPHDSHLLMSSSFTPSISMVTPVTSQGGGVTITPIDTSTNSGKTTPTSSSAILKDVLGTR